MAIDSCVASEAELIELKFGIENNLTCWVYFIVASIRTNGLRLVIYPNDHPPPHVHVLGAGWEIRIELSQTPSLLSLRGGPKTAEIASALMATSENLGGLRTLWRTLHEQDDAA